MGGKERKLVYWPFSEASPLRATSPQTNVETGWKEEDAVFQFSAGSVCTREQTNHSGDPPPPSLPLPNFSLSVQHPTSHLPSLYSPPSLSANWNTEGKVWQSYFSFVDNLPFLGQTPCIPGRHCWSPCHMLMFPTRAATNLLFYFIFYNGSVYKMSENSGN